MTVIVYQPTSGVSWNIMASVLKGVGNAINVTGVGDRALIGAIELDVQAGPRLIAVQGAGGLLTGDYKGAIAVAKAVVAGLHSRPPDRRSRSTAQHARCLGSAS